MNESGRFLRSWQSEVRDIGKTKKTSIALVIALCAAVWPGNMAVGSCQDVMFLLDTSQSMNDSDPGRAAPDSIRAMVFSLGKEDRAGVIAFQTGTSTILSLSRVSPDSLSGLSAVAYEGYTNTGAAVLDALQTLEQDKGQKRSIVIVTDGEIMLPDPDSTLHSAQQFAAGMEAAAREGIPVYILAIQSGREEDYKLYTAYAKDMSVAPGDLLMKSRELMREDLHVCGMELDLQQKTGDSGEITGLSADIPLPEVERAKLLLLATQPGQAKLEGENFKQPDRVLEFQMLSPKGSHLEFQAAYPKGTRLKLDAVPEVDGSLAVEAETSWFREEMTLRVIPVTPGGSKILADKYFDGRTVHLKVNGVEREGRVQEGAILAVLPRENAETVEVENVRFDELGFHFLGINMAREQLSQNRFLPWLLATLGIVVIGILVWLLRRKEERREPVEAPRKVIREPLPPPQKKVPPPRMPESKPKPEPPREAPGEPEPEPAPPVKHEKFYRGKMSIYVTKTPDDSDIEPLSYNLFRRAKGKEITLEEILQGCGVKLKFPGAEGILFGPLNHGIYVQNHSDCTITKRNDILLKGAQTEMYFDEGIHIAFADEASEMILMYKSLKPKE